MIQIDWNMLFQMFCNGFLTYLIQRNYKELTGSHDCVDDIKEMLYAQHEAIARLEASVKLKDQQHID